eukprot:gene19335-4763_t
MADCEEGGEQETVPDHRPHAHAPCEAEAQWVHRPRRVVGGRGARRPAPAPSPVPQAQVGGKAAWGADAVAAAEGDGGGGRRGRGRWAAVRQCSLPSGDRGPGRGPGRPWLRWPLWDCALRQGTARRDGRQRERVAAARFT